MRILIYQFWVYILPLIVLATSLIYLTPIKYTKSLPPIEKPLAVILMLCGGLYIFNLFNPMAIIYLLMCLRDCSGGSLFIISQTITPFTLLLAGFFILKNKYPKLIALLSLISLIGILNLNWEHIYPIIFHKFLY